jgi:hypothetical protein
VTPIRSVDKITIGKGARGPLTAQIQERFFSIVNATGEDKRVGCRLCDEIDSLCHCYQFSNDAMSQCRLTTARLFSLKIPSCLDRYPKWLVIHRDSKPIYPSSDGVPMSLGIDDLLRMACDRKASDLHLKVGNYPYVRVNGELVPLIETKRLTAEDTLGIALGMMTNRQKQKFKENAELDMAYGVAGLGPVPLQLLPAARQHRRGVARHSNAHLHDR